MTQPSPTPLNRYKPWLSWALKAGLSVLAIGIILTKVDPQSALRIAAQQNIPLVCLGAGLIILQIIVGALRWYLLLRGLSVEHPIIRVFSLYYISVFFNACLPGGIGGDVVRGWMASRKTSSAGAIVTSVILDRLITLVGLALIVIATRPLLIATIGHHALIPLLIGTAVACLVGMVVLSGLDYLPKAWQRYALISRMATFSGRIRQFFLTPSWSMPTLVAAVITQLLMALSLYAVAISLNIGISVTDCLIFMPPIALLSTLPISLGGWGVREAAMIGFFGLVGIPTNEILVLSIQFGILTILVSLPGGLLWLFYRQSRSWS